MSPSAILAGLVTGIVLGMFGSGGSIVTIPALLYLLQIEPKSAIAMSMGIVALTATLTALQHWRCGHVNLAITAVFGLFGIFGTYAGARLGVIIPAFIQLSLFALMMYAAAWKMLMPEKATAKTEDSIACIRTNSPLTSRQLYHIALHGIIVGILTGIIGVGGGFLIVPALVLLSGLPMQQAIGTSLAIVALKSYAGFAGYAGDIAVDYRLMLVFTAIAVLGSLAGTRFACCVAPHVLKKGFGSFLLLVATYMLGQNIL